MLSPLKFRILLLPSLIYPYFYYKLQIKKRGAFIELYECVLRQNLLHQLLLYLSHNHSTNYSSISFSLIFSKNSCTFSSCLFVGLIMRLKIIPVIKVINVLVAVVTASPWIPPTPSKETSNPLLVPTRMEMTAAVAFIFLQNIAKQTIMKIGISVIAITSNIASTAPPSKGTIIAHDVPKTAKTIVVILDTFK